MRRFEVPARDVSFDKPPARDSCRHVARKEADRCNTTHSRQRWQGRGYPSGLPSRSGLGICPGSGHMGMKLPKSYPLDTGYAAVDGEVLSEVFKVADVRADGAQ